MEILFFLWHVVMVLLVFGIGIGLFIVPAVWGVVRAFSVGDRNWGIAIAVGWIFAIGWLLGLAYLLGPGRGKRRPVIDPQAPGT